MRNVRVNNVCACVYICECMRACVYMSSVYVFLIKKKYCVCIKCSFVKNSCEY